MNDRPDSSSSPGTATRAARALTRLLPVSLLRYGIVGILQNAVFYLLALALLALGWQAWQAIAVLNPIGVILTFLANRGWSFAGRERRRGQFWGYAIAYGVTYVVAISLTWLFERLGVPSWLALLMTIFIAAAGLYVALNVIVFGVRGDKAPPA